MIELSVIICTHDPRRNHLDRVLEALRRQSLPPERWELLIVDNASPDPLAARFDVGWHPAGRCVREDVLGLTHARVRGIREARAGVLVFVDDDNVLREDYVEQAGRLGAEFPQVGAWGGGVALEFELPPPEWTRRYWYLLAERSVENDARSRVHGDLATTPFGAGLCVRRSVALHYAEHLERSAWRKALGRCGRELLSSEDIDLALTACDLGLEKGVFARLQLTHLIPASRLEEDYLVRLYQGAELGARVLEYCRPGAPRPRPPALYWWIKLGYDYVRRRRRERRFLLARARARRLAWGTFRRLESAAGQVHSPVQSAAGSETDRALGTT